MSTERMTTTEIAHRDHRRAVIYWRWTLFVFTVLSVAGNCAHAYLAAPAGQWPVPVFIAALPPIAFFWLVEGISLLGGVEVANRWGYRFANFVVVVLAVVAFVLSFDTLRDLAATWGRLPRPELAWLFPLLLDSVMAAATGVLYALGDRPVRRAKVKAPKAPRSHRWIGIREAGVRTWAGAPEKGEPAPTEPTPAPAPPPVEPSPWAPSPAEPPAEPAPAAAEAPTPTEEQRAVVAALKQAGKTKADIGQAVVALALLDTGAGGREAGRVSGVGRAAADNLKAAARDHRRQRLVSVGG